MSYPPTAPSPIPRARIHELLCHGPAHDTISQNQPARPSIRKHSNYELIGDKTELSTLSCQSIQLTEQDSQIPLERQNKRRLTKSGKEQEDAVNGQVEVDEMRSDFKWQDYETQLMVLEQQSKMRLLLELLLAQQEREAAIDAPHKVDEACTRQREASEEELNIGACVDDGEESVQIAETSSSHRPSTPSRILR